MPAPRLPGRGIVLFRVGPIEIAIHPSWLIMFAVIALIADSEFVPGLVGRNSGWGPVLAIAIALLFYTFILLHELSHAVLARAHGIDAKRITLFLFGGVAQIGAEAQQPAHEFRIAVAGPLMSLFLSGVLAAISRLLHPNHTGFSGAWGRLAFLNLFLALFNLIPAFPLDGGRVLRAGLWRALRDRARATRWAANMGRAFAFVLMGAGGAVAGYALVSRDAGGTLPGVWYVVLGYFLFTIAGSAGRAEGGARPRGPDRPRLTDRQNAAPFMLEEPVRPFDPPVKVSVDEGQAAEPDPGSRSAGPAVGPAPPRPPADQP